MYQTDRGSYRIKESLFRQFRNSCLGQAVIIAAVIGIGMLIANITKPSETYFMEETDDNVLQCIEEHDSLNVDWIDNVIANAQYMFTTSDSTVDSQMMRDFMKFNNQLRYHDHAFYRTVYLHNNFLPMGKRCGLAIFGMVIPMLDYNDIILREEIMQADTINHPIIKEETDGEYFGENPGLEPFNYHPTAQ